MPRKTLTPGPDHPITVEPHHARLTVRAGATVIADTTDALVLHEADYPPVFYIPRADVDPAAISATDTESYCPYKGEASYWAVRTADGTVIADAAWSYEQPYPAVAAIAGHLAFYPQHVTIGEH